MNDLQTRFICFPFLQKHLADYSPPTGVRVKDEDVVVLKAWWEEL
jgi:hypothetical protein